MTFLEDTATTATLISNLIIRRIPGSTLFIHLCCTSFGAKHRADGKELIINHPFFILDAYVSTHI